MTLEKVIWLEIHIKLNSVNKLFCNCPNVQNFDDLEPNVNICPICTGQPWALPVLNKEPLEKAVLLGLTLWCKVNKYSRFERKSYFYPDLPMGYQITQLETPTNVDWSTSFYVDKEFTQSKTVWIRDAHIEIDTGKSIREWSKVFLDYNRAGTPLVEIVTDPDFRTADEVVWFLKELQRLAKYNNIWDAELESGQMRVDVNISLRKEWENVLNNRVELKNMSSYSAIEKAIEHETARQMAIMEAWEEVDQQTRRRDNAAKESFCMRSKEDANDYRYMPEPDLPDVYCSDEYVEEIRTQWVIKTFDVITRYKNDYWFNKEYINWLIGDPAVTIWFEKTITAWFDPKESAKWIVWPVARWMNDNLKSIRDVAFSYEQYADFLSLIKDWSLQWAQAKVVIGEMITSWKDPAVIIEEKWLKPVGWEQVKAWLEEVFTGKPDVLEDLRWWNMKPMWFVIWQVMQKSWGSANPWMIQEELKKML